MFFMPFELEIGQRNPEIMSILNSDFTKANPNVLRFYGKECETNVEKKRIQQISVTLLCNLLFIVCSVDCYMRTLIYICAIV